MTRQRALRLAREWQQGHVCSLRDGEAEKYHAMFATMLDESTENDSLTLEQLWMMGGKPVYDYLSQEWYVIQEYYDHELTMTDGTRFFDDDEIDGVDKRFYCIDVEKLIESLQGKYEVANLAL